MVILRLFQLKLIYGEEIPHNGSEALGSRLVVSNVLLAKMRDVCLIVLARGADEPLLCFTGNP